MPMTGLKPLFFRYRQLLQEVNKAWMIYQKAIDKKLIQ
jgi:hypothetical protein